MGALDQLYQQIILDAARERHGEGTLDNPDGESFQVNPTCGDEVKMQVKLSADGSHLESVAWEGHGCSISQASISIMTEMLEGRSLSDITEIYNVFREMMDNRGKEITAAEEELLDSAAAFQGVSKFPARIKCALLGWMALRDATAQASLEEGREDV